MIRCKMKCTYKEAVGDGANIRLDAVTSGSPENKEFFKSTPSGEIRLFTVNPNAAAQFEQRKDYYVDLTPCEQAVDLETALSPVSDEPNQDFD